MKKRNCFIGQSGGPTVVINSSLAGIIHECSIQGFDHIYGMINGIQGLLEDNYLDLKEIFLNQKRMNLGRAINDDTLLELLKTSPAMYLGSCRYKLPVDFNHEDYVRLFDKFEKLDITDFFYIGGNDSMDTVAKLSEYAEIHDKDIHFIGIPKTIDNDLMGTDHTPGFGSAAKYVASSMLEISYDSSIYKLDAVTIVEIMGRNAGWLTAASALARTEFSQAPDLIYLPEVPFVPENFLDDIREKFKEKSSIIIAVSEGIKTSDGKYLDENSQYTKRDAFGHVLHSGTGKVLETMVYKEFGCKVRSIELNVLQRCAMHIASKTDLDEAFEIGRFAVSKAIEDQTGIMIVLERVANFPYQSICKTMDVSQIANLEHTIPLEWINEKHNNITGELYQYLYPLIEGEVLLNYRGGIPHYIDIRHLGSLKK